MKVMIIIIFLIIINESDHSEKKTKANQTRPYEPKLKRFETLKERK